MRGGSSASAPGRIFAPRPRRDPVHPGSENRRPGAETTFSTLLTMAIAPWLRSMVSVNPPPPEHPAGQPSDLGAPSASPDLPEPPEPPALAALRRSRAERAAVLRRRARPVVLAVAVILAATVAQSTPRPGLHGTSLGITLAGCCLIAATVAALRTNGPMWGAPRRGTPAAAYLSLFALLIASSVALALLQPQGPGTVGLFLAVALAARAFPSWASAAFTAGCLAFFAALFFVGHASWHVTRQAGPGLVVIIALVAVYSMSRFRRRIREQETREDRLVAELAESRGAELKAAALAERQRLAREMHDVLAHSLSGLVVQLEGARLLAATSPADLRLPSAIDRAHQLAKSGLDEARQAIGMLRGDELPGPERIAALAAAFEADTGVPCRFTREGPPRELDPAVRLALYRVTQEALTNVRKHASPDAVTVRLEYLPDAVTLAVEDSGADRGAGAAPDLGGAAAVGGYGLAGMRERATLLGGTLTAAATPVGFRVVLWVPA